MQITRKEKRDNKIKQEKIKKKRIWKTNDSNNEIKKKGRRKRRKNEKE